MTHSPAFEPSPRRYAACPLPKGEGAGLDILRLAFFASSGRSRVDRRVIGRSQLHVKRESLTQQPRSGERFFRRSAAHFSATLNHGFQPWLHSNAALRLGAFTATRPKFFNLQSIRGKILHSD